MHNDTTVRYIIGSTELLDAVGPLWEKLTAHHAARSPYFAVQYAEYTYAERKARFLAHTKPTTLRVELVQDMETSSYVGYCVSSINGEAGEIDSIFIEADYRGQGIGDTLMLHALTWMKAHNVSSKQVVVAVGNEQVFDFYRQYGFQPRHIVLQQVQN